MCQTSLWQVINMAHAFDYWQTVTSSPGSVVQSYVGSRTTIDLGTISEEISSIF